MKTGNLNLMKSYTKREVVKLIRKALKESKEPFSFMDIHGERKWMEKFVK